MLDSTRQIMAAIQFLLDSTGAIGCIYILALVTQNYGWGSAKARLQLAHRIALLGVSSAFAYHAYDITVNLSKHGLTPPNIILHTILIACVIISAVRIRQGQHELEARGGSSADYRNGDILAGPMR